MRRQRARRCSALGFMDCIIKAVTTSERTPHVELKFDLFRGKDPRSCN
jgi:hypothetical protein